MPSAVKANCVELTVVEGRCVYLNNHRIVGNKPYVSENLRHSFYQVPVADVLSALGSTIEQSSIVAATVKQDLTVEPVRNRYKLGEPCGACGGMPGDWAFDPWENLPWIVTMNYAHFPRFLIDRRDSANRDMFSGFKINRHGSIGEGISLTTGSGGRLNLHRSYFLEDLPA